MLLNEFYGPFGGMIPGVLGLGDSESLFTHLKTKKIIAEKYLERHFACIQQALEEGDLENAYWLPGMEDPADSSTKVRNEMATLLRLLESGAFFLGHLRPLKGVAWREQGAAFVVLEFTLHVRQWILLEGEWAILRGTVFGSRSPYAPLSLAFPL